MTALGDPEDAAPHERITLPPLEHFEEPREADTEPPPAAVDIEAVTRLVAGLFESHLGKRLDRIEAELFEVRTRVGALESKADAFDKGISGSFQLVNDAAANIERIADAIGPRRESQPPLFEAVRDLTAKVESLQSWRESVSVPHLVNGGG